CTHKKKKKRSERVHLVIRVKQLKAKIKKCLQIVSLSPIICGEPNLHEFRKVYQRLLYVAEDEICYLPSGKKGEHLGIEIGNDGTSCSSLTKANRSHRLPM
ncbi:unnamed protein product, partial [Brassica oleracea var. botrytis]